MFLFSLQISFTYTKSEHQEFVLQIHLSEDEKRKVAPDGTKGVKCLKPFFLYQCSFKKSVESRRLTGLEIELKKDRSSA